MVPEVEREGGVGAEETGDEVVLECVNRFFGQTSAVNLGRVN